MKQTEAARRQQYLMAIDPRFRIIRERISFMNASTGPAVERAIKTHHDEDPVAYHTSHLTDESTCRTCLRDLSILRRQLAEDEELPEKPLITRVREAIREQR